MKFVISTANYFTMKILKSSIILIFVALVSCSSNKSLYNSKEYDKVVNNLTNKASKNKLNESQFEYLYKAYHQANQDDFTKIMELKKSGQPDIWTDIYYRTNSINERQNKVDKLSNDIKTALDYKKLNLDEELNNSKNKAENFLCAKTNQLLKEPDVNNIKEAEVLINQLQRLSPNNQNIENLRLRLVISSAQRIIFRIATPTELYLPDDFAKLALDFDDNTIYDVPFDIVPIDSLSYDLMILVMINEKKISPERIDAVTFEEKNGDKIAKVTDKTMSKTATIIGEIELIDVKSKDVLIKTPFDISSTFYHKYAIFEGDKEACSKQTLSLLNSEAIDFPQDNALLKDVSRQLNKVLKSHYQKN